MATKCLLFIIIFFLLTISSLSKQNCKIFQFGDSNSDTGGMMAANGATLFPAILQQFNFTRLSYQRVYVDYLCESLEIPYLSPYLQSLGSDFRHGVNFAYCGAVAENNHSKSPYTLPIQVNQFSLFRGLTRVLRLQGRGPMITDEEFGKAIYAIDIGQNDLFLSFDGTDYSVIVSDVIPKILNDIKTTVKRIYDLGGRKYLLYNTGPLGCLPAILGNNNYGTERDEANCMVGFNKGSKAFNEGFTTLCDKMKSELKDALIVCVDMYSIKYDLFAYPSKYGFNSSHGQTVDGIHYSDVASAIVASKIMSGYYSQPQIRLGELC